MMRAVKFSSRLGFRIEKDTLAAMKNYHACILNASQPRVCEEVFRLFPYGHSEKALRLLYGVGMLGDLLPDLAACIAAEDLREKYPEAKILVIDSLSASRGQGMLLYRAVRERREKNLTIDELDAYVRSIIQSQCHWFIVDDLNHLKRGGRVSSTAALVGTMLGIKPVMHTDSEGRLTPVSKARGTKAALRALVDKVGEIGVEPEKNQPMLICHANCPESVEYVKGLLKERFGVTDVRDEFIGPVIGAHTGCGTLGLFFVGTER